MSEQRTTPSRWAPWWVYLIAVVGVNGVSQLVFPRGALPTPLDVAVGIGLALAAGVVVTVAHRATRGRPGSAPPL